MTGRRILILGFLVAAAVALVLLLRGLSSLDGIVAAAIERHGSDATGTEVRVQNVEVSLADARATVQGLSIGNPPGFRSPEVLRFGRIEVEIEAGSLLAGPIVLRRIVIEDPLVTYEVNEAGASNVDVIRRHAEKAKPQREEAEADTAGEQHGAEREKPRFVIDMLLVERGKLVVDEKARRKRSLEVMLPSLVLRDIGRPQGATPEEIGRRVVVAAAGHVAATIAADEARRYVEKHFGKDAADAAGEIIEKGAGILNELLGR